jgi:hypothetical protein
MPNNEQIRQLSQTVINELEHIGGSTAPVACVQVAPTDEGVEYIFVTRGPFNYQTPPSSRFVNYVRYRLPMGRLAEAEPGKEAAVTVDEYVGNTRTGHVFISKYLVHCKDTFRVSNDAAQIDAIENDFTFPDTKFNIPSLRELLSRPAEDLAIALAQPIRRLADRFELADLAVVDKAQGEIWRLDIRKFIIIEGAPGTGKTTTAIKRIGQKTDETALIEGKEVIEYPAEELRKWLKGPTGWTFFTPSELLRSYLQEALAREGLAATEEHVPVWETAKIRIARDTLGFIGQDRFLKLGKNLVAARDSKSLTSWTKKFIQHFEARIQRDLTIELDRSLNSILGKIPIVYQEYRLRASEGGHFYHAGAMGAVNDKRVDPIELDTLIFAALITLRERVAVRDIVQRDGNSKSIAQRLINEFRYVVAVDEATDFSTVELACMRLLAHPIFNCATFTGDLMQRMTSRGIKSWKEIDDLVSPPSDKHNLKLSYRQSRKLLRIAEQLYEKALGHPAPFSAGYAEDLNDPDALWDAAESKEDQANWIVKRIGELHRIWQGTLHPVAVFVPDEADVSSTAELLRGLLLEAYGIETEACLEGRILGTQAKVRVFSVQFIKGLEFEAVFFLGADRMAAVSPGLVDRFLYVGLTRARSFLALITHDEFPQALIHVRNHFKQGTWENLVPPQDSTET